MDRLAEKTAALISTVPDHEVYGRVTKILGLLVEITGFGDDLVVGSMAYLRPDATHDIPCEVVGFKDKHALLMPFGALEGVGLGCRAFIQNSRPVVFPSERWLGRVINALGKPIDDLGPLAQGAVPILLKSPAPPAHTRQRVGEQLDLGVRAVNNFTAMCRGQRMGIFAGSGVGKSVTLSMMARYTDAEIIVIGLVGERGREVQEFLEDDLGEEGLKRSCCYRGDR